MVAPWFWLFRNPALALAAVFLAAGVAEILSPGLSLMSTAVLFVIADVSHHFGHRARRRKEQKAAVLTTLAEARQLRERHGRQRGQRAA